jgi:hypothetical protein
MVGTTRGVSANTRDERRKTRGRRRDTREDPFGRLRDLITKRKLRLKMLMA